MQTVGVVRTDFLKKNPELIRGIIQARRKGVEFIQKNPDEAAAIMAKEYKIAAGGGEGRDRRYPGRERRLLEPRRLRLRGHADDASAACSS